MTYIATTHVGSMPRGAELTPLLKARDAGEPYDAYVQRIGARPALKRAWAKDSPDGHI